MDLRMIAGLDSVVGAVLVLLALGVGDVTSVRLENSANGWKRSCLG
ncbi:hypothetical protein [Nonomuraea sp. KM88]